MSPMNDITALAQRMKAAAEKATPGRIGDRIDGSGSIKYECRGDDGSLVLRTDHKNMEYGFVGDNGTADEQFFRACVPANVLALVETLEKSQRMEDYWKTQCRGIVDHSEKLQAQIARLEKKLSDRKRMNQEMATAMLKPVAEESRTVTVKLPDPLMPAKHNSGELFMTPDNVIHGGYLNRDDVLRNLRAAGIQVIEGEG